MRILSGRVKFLVYIFCIAAALFHLYIAAFGALAPRVQRPMHLGFMLPLAFLFYPAKREKEYVIKGDDQEVVTNKTSFFEKLGFIKNNKNYNKDVPTIIDWILAFVSFYVFCVYMLLNEERLQWRWVLVDPVSTMDMICGVIAVALLLEATRRAVAPAMAVLAMIAILFLGAGPYLQGRFAHDGFTLARTVEVFYLANDLGGMFGMLTGISSSFIALFVIFGSFVAHTSVGDYFNAFATALVGRTVGGPAKMAVVSSGAFGMISGVGASNVYTTGTFTIPMMKKNGFTPEFAGAVEATASTGGQYMPPVMGTGAFIMSEITGIPYVSICVAAVISAFLFYITLLLMVHLKALKLNIPLLKVDAASWMQILRDSWKILPVFVLIAAFAMGYSPLYAGLLGIGSTGVLGIWSGEIRGVKFLDCLYEGTINTVLVALACACAGLIIAVISYTGIGIAFSGVVMNIAKSSVFLALAGVMFACICLGMGLPTGAAYIMASTLAIPALTKMGMDLLACHLFVFYAAIYSELTPPVAICAYVGAQIAKADPTKTGIEAFKLGITALIIPYAFVSNNALIMKGSLVQIVLSIILALSGLMIVSFGIVGYFNKYFKKLIGEHRSSQLFVRVILIIVGTLIVFVPQIIDFFNISNFFNTIF